MKIRGGRAIPTDKHKKPYIMLPINRGKYSPHNVEGRMNSLYKEGYRVVCMSHKQIVMEYKGI